MKTARILVLLMLPLLVIAAPTPQTGAQTDSRYFPETHHTIQGRFLAYWTSHGGLAQQGYPLSEEFSEISTLDHKVYTVQYFERAVFEYHPEYAGTPYEVLLTLLGRYEYEHRYPGGAANQQANKVNPRVFTETGHTVGGAFRAY